MRLFVALALPSVVARVRKGAHPAPRAPVRAPVGPFAAAEVVLYRSELGPAGARYTPLAATVLGADGP